MEGAWEFGVGSGYSCAIGWVELVGSWMYHAVGAFHGPWNVWLAFLSIRRLAKFEKDIAISC